MRGRPFTFENAREMGSRGGRKTVQVHGVTHMRTIGKAGFMATTERHFQGCKRHHLEMIQARARAVMDPMPWNGAWQPKGDRRVV